eukprot:ANDGO_04123.mRNA.1 Calpain-type cysteine protease ADL1
MALESSTSDSEFDETLFRSYALSLGLPFFIMLILSFSSLQFLLHWNVFRWPVWIAKLQSVAKIPWDFKWTLAVLEPVLVFLTVAPPVGLLLAWSIVVCAKISPVVVGLTMLFFGGFILPFASALLRWATQGFFPWSRGIYAFLVSSLVFFVAYELTVVFGLKPFTFTGVSAIMFALNMLCITMITFYNTQDSVELPSTAPCIQTMDTLVDGEFELGFGTSAVSSFSVKRQFSRKMKSIVLYVVSVGILLAYALVVKFRTPDGATGGASNLGFIMGGCVLFIDINVALYITSGFLVSPLAVLGVSTICRIALFSFGDEVWFLGICLLYVFFGLLFSTSLVNHRVSLEKKSPQLSMGFSLVKLKDTLKTLTNLRSNRISRREMVKVFQTPEFNLLFLTIPFIAGVIAVSKVAGIATVSVMDGQSHGQWEFGVAAILILIPYMFILTTLRLLYRQEWLLSTGFVLSVQRMDTVKDTVKTAAVNCGAVSFAILKQPSVWVALAAIVVSGLEGLLLYFITRSFIVLFCFIFAFPALLCALYFYLVWKKGEYKWVKPSVWVWAFLFVALFVAWGGLIAATVSPTFIGWSICVCPLIVVFSFLPVVEWFQTLKLSVFSMIIESISFITLILYGIIFYYTSLNGVPSNSALVLLFCVLAYPIFVSTVSGFIVWKDNKWKLQTSSIILLSFALACFVAFMIAVFVVLSIIAGVVLLFILFGAAAAVFTIVRWVSNNYYLPPRHVQVVGGILMILAGIGVGIGFATSYAFGGFSMFAASIFCLFMALAAMHLYVHLRNPHCFIVWSEYIFPVYKFSQTNDLPDVVASSLGTVALYCALFTLLIWGVVATLFLSPAWIGMDVSSFALLCLFVCTVWFSRFVRHQLHLVSPYCPEPVIKACINSARNRYFNALISAKMIEDGPASAPEHSAHDHLLIDRVFYDLSLELAVKQYDAAEGSEATSPYPEVTLMRIEEKMPHVELKESEEIAKKYKSECNVAALCTEVFKADAEVRHAAIRFLKYFALVEMFVWLTGQSIMKADEARWSQFIAERLQSLYKQRDVFLSGNLNKKGPGDGGATGGVTGAGGAASSGSQGLPASPLPTASISAHDPGPATPANPRVTPLPVDLEQIAMVPVELRDQIILYEILQKQSLPSIKNEDRMAVQKDYKLYLEKKSEQKREDERKQKEDEEAERVRRQRLLEDEKKRKDEENRRRSEDDAIRLRLQEEERRRLEEEEEGNKRRLEEEQRKREELERIRLQNEEQRKREEIERLRLQKEQEEEEEEERRREAERKRRDQLERDATDADEEEEERRRKNAENERRREIERKRQEAVKRKQEEEEKAAQRKAEEEAKKKKEKEEEERRRKAETEKNRSSLSSADPDVIRLTEAVQSSKSNRTLFKDKVFSDRDAQAIGKSGFVWGRMNAEQRANADVIKAQNTDSSVAQGSLGDCWLLSAMTVVAMDRTRIEDMFLKPVGGSLKDCVIAGVYSVKLFVNGRQESVMVDDFLPYDDNRSGPAFAQSVHEGELWPAIVEKAFAKRFGGGSYSGIEGGFVHTGLTSLTGGIPESTKTSERLWQKMLTAFESGFLMGAGSSAGKDTDSSSEGIVQGHAYAILNVVEIDDIRLVRLRNPWGQGEWTGDYCDDSPLWTPRLRAKLGPMAPGVADDGAFYMSFEAFIENFPTLYLCRVVPKTWKKAEALGEWKGETAGGSVNNAAKFTKNPQYLLKVTKPTTVYILLAQVLDVVDASSFYHMGFMVFNKNGLRCAKATKSTLIHATTYSNMREVSAELTLEPGQYTIVPSTFDAGMERPFVLTAYSAIPDSIDGTLVWLDPANTAAA